MRLAAPAVLRGLCGRWVLRAKRRGGRGRRAGAGRGRGGRPQEQDVCRILLTIHTSPDVPSPAPAGVIYFIVNAAQGDYSTWQVRRGLGSRGAAASSPGLAAPAQGPAARAAKRCTSRTARVHLAAAALCRSWSIAAPPPGGCSSCSASGLRSTQSSPGASQRPSSVLALRGPALPSAAAWAAACMPPACRHPFRQPQTHGSSSTPTLVQGGDRAGLEDRVDSVCRRRRAGGQAG